jgi:hypothetical protein
LIDRYSGRTVKGEIVLVVAGSTRKSRRQREKKGIPQRPEGEPPE